MDVADQISHTITREYAICMRELNIQAWSRDVQVGDEIQELVNNRTDKQATNAGDARGQSESFESPRLKNQQAAECYGGPINL